MSSLLVLMLLNLLGQAQSLSLVKSWELPSDIDVVEVDQFGHIYVVKGPEIRKLDSEGKFLASFADPNFGDISQIDLLNALNPLIYYADFNQIRILDNRLNESQVLSLLSLGFNDPKLVAYSDQNRIWVYDQSADRMIQYSIPDRRIVNQGPIIRQLGIGSNPVLDLKSGFNYSLMQIQHQGFLVFDALGAKKEFIADGDSILSFDFDNRRWASINSKGLIKLYPIDSGRKVQLLASPHKAVKKLILRDLSLYLWVADKLYLYHFD